MSASKFAPAHIRRAHEAFLLATISWEAGLEAAMAGGRTLAAGGRPARGERFPDEERDYRAVSPAPVFKDFLAAEYAAMRPSSSVAAGLEAWAS